MSDNIIDRLMQLEDKFRRGDVPEAEYKEDKWELLREVCQEGLVLTPDEAGFQTEEITDGDGNLYCYVDHGPFVFGPDDDYCELKAPLYIAKHPVTVEQFLDFLDNSRHPYSDEDREQMRIISPDLDCPVSHISWDDAKEYCRWLRKTKQEYYSLPHEIEWERAARGVDGRFHPWGNHDPTPDLACFRSDQIDHTSTASVHAYPDNHSPVGCTSMVGNTWEWCLDSFKEDQRDPHILRGGSWCNPADYANCVARTFSFPPDKRIDFAGFRLTYLPHDMLLEYRRQYAGGIASSKAKLTVVTQARRKRTVPKTGATDPSVHPASQPAAANMDAANDTAAASELNEMMAAAISEAANLYKKSQTEDNQRSLSSSQRPASASTNATGKIKVPMADLGSTKAATNLDIKKTGKPAPKPARPEVKGETKKKSSALTYVALVTWSLLFLAVLGLFIQKVITLG